MTDEPWLITENEAFVYRGGLVALTYDELLDKIKKLERDNTELRAHIERWVQFREQHHKRKTGHEYCIICELQWPCPTEVAKGWRE